MEQWLKREFYLSMIRPYVGKPVVKLIKGIRHCGKTVMLELVKRELVDGGVDPSSIISYDFESMELAPLCSATALRDEAASRLRGRRAKSYLFFDEVQEVPGWEDCAASLLSDFDCDIFATASSLAPEDAGSGKALAGRCVEFAMHPLSFREFSDLLAREKPGLGIPGCFEQYLMYGGMPYLCNLHYRKDPVLQYLRDLVFVLELKDIVRRRQIRDVKVLESIFAHVASSLGKPLSATAISRHLDRAGIKVAPETVLNYLSSGIGAFLFRQVRRQDLATGRILDGQSKYYLADHGILWALMGGTLLDVNLMLENIVFIELLRRGFEVTAGRTAGGREIDFVARRGSERIYVQVTHLLACPDIVEREFGAYRHVRDNYPKYVLSLDDFDMSRDGIIHMNVRDFLLGKGGQAGALNAWESAVPPFGQGFPSV
ncbi:MAG: ATP-binding protein [Succinivibrio sp.]